MARSWMTRLAVAITTTQILSMMVSAQELYLSSASATLIGGSQSLATISTSVLTSPPLSSTTPTPTGPRVHTITAGAGGFKFTPPSISNVSVGDTVTFEFYPPDHSVARAEFGSACVPYEYTGRDKVGFWSETQWVNTTADITHWNLTINSTEPIFFYCAAPKSCIDKLMVGAINPNDTQRLEDQIQAAIAADFQVAPGESIPPEASATLANAPTAAPSSPSTPSHSGSHGLSGGAIAGIVVGAVGFLAICAALFFFVGRSKTLKEVIQNQEANNRQNPDPHQSMASYAPGGIGSSSGFPSPTPYSGPNGADGFGGFNSPPLYGQQYATDQQASEWGSPPHSHAGFTTDYSRMSQQPVSEMKYAVAGVQQAPVELHSSGRQELMGEMDATDVPKPK